VRPQEVVPADCTLLDLDGAIDYAFVSGESAAQRLCRGDLVAAGGRVVDRALRLSVTRPVSQSRLAELWNHPVFARVKSHWMTTVLRGTAKSFQPSGTFPLTLASAAFFVETGPATSFFCLLKSQY